jgi:hypothetical protein
MRKPYVCDKAFSKEGSIKGFNKYADAHRGKKPSCFKAETIAKARERVKSFEEASRVAPKPAAIVEAAPAKEEPAPTNSVVYDCDDAASDGTGSTLELLETAVEKYETVKTIAIEREQELLEEIEALEARVAVAESGAALPALLIEAIEKAYEWDPEDEPEKPLPAEMMATISRVMMRQRNIINKLRREVELLKHGDEDDD